MSATTHTLSVQNNTTRQLAIQLDKVKKSVGPNKTKELKFFEQEPDLNLKLKITTKKYNKIVTLVDREISSKADLNFVIA